MTPDSVTFPPPRHTCMQSWKRDFLVPAWSTLKLCLDKLVCFLWKNSRSAKFWVSTSVYTFSGSVQQFHLLRRPNQAWRSHMGSTELNVCPRKFSAWGQMCIISKLNPTKSKANVLNEDSPFLLKIPKMMTFPSLRVCHVTSRGTYQRWHIGTRMRSLQIKWQWLVTGMVLNLFSFVI